MGPSKTGVFPWKRTILPGAAALLLLATLFPLSSRAADITLTSKTYFLYYQRELAGGDKEKLAPVYEYLAGDARNLGGGAVSFHFYGWGRLDLQDASQDGGKSTGELGSAWLQYSHPTGNAEARLGRFFFAEGTASEIVDGIFLKARTPMGLGASVFGGKPVERSIVAADTGDSLFGGRVFFARPGFAEIGVTYIGEKGDFEGDDRKSIGGDLWVRPAGFIELNGRASYNQATKKLAEQRYVVRLMPHAAVDLSAGYDQYRYKDLFQRALNPAFLFPAVDNTDQVRIVFAVVDWEAVKNLTVEAVFKHIRHDRADPGDASRGELGLRYSYSDRKDTAGLSAAVVRADRDENEYQEYRGFASYSPAKWRFALDALTQRYKEAINGVKSAYHAVASAGYQVIDILQLSGDLTYTKGPRFEKDFAGLVKAQLILGTTTGGKK